MQGSNVGGDGRCFNIYGGCLELRSRIVFDPPPRSMAPDVP